MTAYSMTNARQQKTSRKLVNTVILESKDRTDCICMGQQSVPSPHAWAIIKALFIGS